MTLEKLVWHLAMTDRRQIRAAQPVRNLVVERAEQQAEADRRRILALHDAIATPHHWSSLDRTEDDWGDVLEGTGRSHWVARADGVDIGWASLHATAAAGVQIPTFGLLPDVVGLGYGGAFLTAVVNQAWRQQAALPGSPSRVWLGTTSWDHPRALPNYLARGFTVERLELRTWTDGTEWASEPVASAPSLLVRPAVADHADAVRVLLHHLGYDQPAEEVRERLARLASAPDAVTAVVVTSSDEVVGVVAAHVVPLLAEVQPGFIRITALAVSPDAVRQGVGRRLIEFVEYIARRRGISLVEVSSGRRPERDAAHRFYSSRGFRDASSSAVRYWKHLG